MFAYLVGQSAPNTADDWLQPENLAPFDLHTIDEHIGSHGQALTARRNPSLSLSDPDSFWTGKPGDSCLFDGWLDNRQELAAELSAPPGWPTARLYHRAVEEWGDDADLHVVGHYASVVTRADGNVRLSRSPIEARPLHWAWIDGRLVIASLPRLLVAAGLPLKLNKRTLLDSMFLNLTETEGWLENSWRLGVGELVHLSKDKKQSEPIRYWDPASIPVQGSASPTELIEQTEVLLEGATRSCLSDAETPGMLLSAGLDSSNVASRAMRILGPTKAFPSFTFVPSSVWEGFEPHWGYGDETGRVREFAGMHPSLNPHFIANEERDFDSDWDKVFAAIGCAPPGLTNVWMYHGIHSAAKNAGCDRLICADYGNQSFSIAADWAPAEFVRRGNVLKAWQQISGNRIAISPRWRRFLRAGFAANLPEWLWRLWQKAKGRNLQSPNEMIAALNPAAMARNKVTGRAHSAGLLSYRTIPPNRADWIRDIFARGDLGSGEIALAFEQIYGITTRDPTANRRLIEHCLSLPTEMFARDRQDRWLAREMSRGHLPEDQRCEQLAGMHQADWHARMTPKIPEIRAELQQAAARAELRELFDFDELLGRLDDWPANPDDSDETTYRMMMGIPIALMTARFIRHSYGWNE